MKPPLERLVPCAPAAGLWTRREPALRSHAEGCVWPGARCCPRGASAGASALGPRECLGEAAPLTSAAGPERGADRPGRHPPCGRSSGVRCGAAATPQVTLSLADQNPPAPLWKPGLGSNVARLDEQFDSRPRCPRNVGLGGWTKLQVPTQEPLRADGCRTRCQADPGTHSLPGRVTSGSRVLHRGVRALRSLSPGLRVRSQGLDETPACLPTRRPPGTRRVGARLGLLTVRVAVRVSVSGRRWAEPGSSAVGPPCPPRGCRVSGAVLAAHPGHSGSGRHHRQPDFSARVAGRSGRRFLGLGTSSATRSQTESSDLGPVCVKQDVGAWAGKWVVLRGGRRPRSRPGAGGASRRPCGQAAFCALRAARPTVKPSRRRGARGSRGDCACGVGAVGGAGGAGTGRQEHLLFPCPTVADGSVLIVTSTLPKKRLHYVTMPFSSNKRATLSRGDGALLPRDPAVGLRPGAAAWSGGGGPHGGFEVRIHGARCPEKVRSPAAPGSPVICTH